MPLADKARIGCSGWSYKDWVGPFYPKGLPAGEYLSFYSKVFDCVEVDSSFYRIPYASMVQRWKSVTPENFVFSPKLPRKITHENKLVDFESTLAYFYSVVSKLGSKLGPIVAQLPPSVKSEKHSSEMRAFVKALNPRYKHAIEFRHKSWFQPETYKLLSENNVAMVWSLNQYLETPAEVTSDFVYLRMVGERDITNFGSVQKERKEEMEKWSHSLKEKEGSFDNAYVFFNNHFAGFGPESVNEFRRLLGMIEADWKEAESPPSDQQTLEGF